MELMRILDGHFRLTTGRDWRTPTMDIRQSMDAQERVSGLLDAAGDPQSPFVDRNGDYEDKGESPFEEGVGGAGYEIVSESNEMLATPRTSGDELVSSDTTALGHTVILAEPTTEGKDVHVVPEVGMLFPDPSALYEFYKGYAYREGFPIRKRSSRKGNNGTVRYMVYECGRAGHRQSTAKSVLRPRPTKQTDCQARISACSDSSGEWRINTVYLEHNHKCSPSKYRMYRSNREVSSVLKKTLNVNGRAEIRLSESFEAAATEAGGYEMLCIEKDCRNFIEKTRRLRLGEGDATALQAFCVRMQSQCPGFFYSIDLDDEGRLRYVFWADNRSRQAYKEFGDVVLFDTMYLVNKYEMPLAPFVCVNHHGQSTLLGCGLLSCEDIDSFAWLFTTWLKCMGGRAPSGIITDQVLGMKDATELVFPETKHRWCLWHIMKKLPEKFGGHTDKDAVMKSIQEAVYNTHFPEEFEEEWAVLIDKYHLGDHKWCLDMYAERTRWVPCYLKTAFWAGMSTTQRSENMNALFDGFVNSKTTLKQFVELYGRALKSKVEKEFEEDYKSFAQQVPCATVFKMEKLFQEAYTQKKFQEFQKELGAQIYCNIIAAVEDDYPGAKYRVLEHVVLDDERTKMKEFVVSFVRDDLQASCSCHWFEFRGIVCGHVIKVLLGLNIHTIHERYILRRWRKDVYRAHSRIVVGNDGWFRTLEQERIDQILNTAGKLAEKVAPDEDQCRRIVEWMESQIRDLPITLVPNVAILQCIDKSVQPVEPIGMLTTLY